MFVFIAITLLLIPMLLLSHPRRGGAPRSHFVVPGVPGGITSGAVLLIIAIVGTTVAPWQLFFQQSNVVDKRITPRFIGYERADTVLGAVVVVVGAAAIVMTGDWAARSTNTRGRFHRRRRPSPTSSVNTAASSGRCSRSCCSTPRIIGAAAVTLATSYAFGDVFGLKHSLHRSFARRQTVLPVLLRDGRGRRGDRAHPRRAAGVDHHRRAGTGRAAAAQRQRVPAAAVQRPRSAGPVGEPALAQRRSPASSSVCC